MNKPDRNYTSWVQYANIGTQMGSSVIVGAAIGYFLDRWLHTAPWMTAAWTILGAMAGFRALFRGIADLDRREQERKTKRK
jgi:ATP synthase protein I